MLRIQDESLLAGVRAHDSYRQPIQDCFEGDQIRRVIIDDQYRWALQRHVIVSWGGRDRGNSAMVSHASSRS
jgi:hypothetical protein